MRNKQIQSHIPAEDTYTVTETAKDTYRATATNTATDTYTERLLYLWLLMQLL